jgi:lysophospholipase L1-like esterase
MSGLTTAKMLALGLLGGGGLPYYQQVKNLFGANLIQYLTLGETSGVTALDSSGNGRDGAYGAGAAAPTLADLAFPFGGSLPHFDGGDYVNAYSTSFRDAFNPLAGFVSVWCRIDEAAFQDLTYDKIFRFRVDTNNWVYIEKAGNNTDRIDFFYRAGGTITTVAVTQISTLWGGLLHLGLTWSKANDRVRAFINGVQVGADQSGLGVWAGVLAATVTNIGAADQAGTDPLLGHAGHVAVGNREATPAEMAALHNNCPRRLIVFEGDSRTVGTGATNIGYGYPAKTARKLTGNWQCANVGASGQSLVHMNTQIAAEIAPLADPGLGRVAVLWGGVNDNEGAEAMHARLVTWCTAVRALGYRVVVCTEIDAQDAPRLASGWPTNYLALNELIRANYATYADGLADLGGNAALQNAADVTYYNADKVHLNNDGYSVVAGIVAAAVSAV